MTTLSGGSSQQKNAAADGIRSERTTANDSEVLGQQSMGSTTVTQAYANVLDNQHLFGSSYGGGMDSERSTLLDAYGVALNFFKDQTASYLWPAGTSQHAYAEHRKAIDEAILTGDVWELYKHEPTFEDLHDFRRFERMREAEAIQRAARGTNQRARRNLLPMRPSIAEGMLPRYGKLGYKYTNKYSIKAEIEEAEREAASDLRNHRRRKRRRGSGTGTVMGSDEAGTSNHDHHGTGGKKKGGKHGTGSGGHHVPYLPVVPMKGKRHHDDDDSSSDDDDDGGPPYPPPRRGPRNRRGRRRRRRRSSSSSSSSSDSDEASAKAYATPKDSASYYQDVRVNQPGHGHLLGRLPGLGMYQKYLERVFPIVTHAFESNFLVATANTQVFFRQNYSLGLLDGTQWFNLASMFRFYRIRKARLRLFPKVNTNNNTNYASSTASRFPVMGIWHTTFENRLSPPTIAAGQSSESFRIYSQFSPIQNTVKTWCESYLDNVTVNAPVKPVSSFIDTTQGLHTDWYGHDGFVDALPVTQSDTPMCDAWITMYIDWKFLDGV